jgi:hypothetical protein
MTTDDADVPPATTDAPASGRDALVETIYRVALEPKPHDVFGDHWNDHVARAVAGLARLREQVDVEDAELQAHLETASNILEEIGARRSDPLHEGNGPRMLLDAAGSIAWSNASAGQLFEVSPRDSIEALEPFLGEAKPFASCSERSRAGRAA